MREYVKKLGLGIVAFESTEHLSSIIEELKGLIDYVVIGMQKVSYHGDKIDIDDYKEIYRLKNEDHLVDEIIEIELNSSKAPREQETDKRNLLIQHIEDAGCTHAIIIDSDEFYTHKSFEKALNLIDQNKWKITYCQYINYYHDFEHYLVYPFKQGMYVPFITEVQFRFKFESTDFPLPSDPTRRYQRPSRITGYKTEGRNKIPQRAYFIDYQLLPWNLVKMHHLSWIRENIRKKLNDWSSKKCFADYEDLIDKAVCRFNRFSDDNINEDACLLFNTPGNKVQIDKFPKQYIHPKYDFMTRLRHYPEDKKILIMLLSCNEKFFTDYEDVVRETWAKEISEGKESNISLFFYRAAPDGKERIEGDVVYVDCPDILSSTYTKFAKACELLKKAGKFDFDYLYRGNTSTWVNVPLLKRFAASRKDDSYLYSGSVYAAYWSGFRPYSGGNSMLLSYHNIDILLNNQPKNLYDLEHVLKVCDDVLIGYEFCNRLDALHLDYYDFFRTYGEICYDDLIDDPRGIKKGFDYIAVKMKMKNNASQSKDFRSDEFDKYREFDAAFRGQNISDEDFDKMHTKLVTEMLNVDSYISPATKEEFFAMTEEEKNKMRYAHPCTLSELKTNALEARNRSISKHQIARQTDK